MQMQIVHLGREGRGMGKREKAAEKGQVTTQETTVGNWAHSLWGALGARIRVILPQG